MTRPITFFIDGKEIRGREGQTILQAALEAGIYIPHLCFHPDLEPFGSCRVCTVIANGRTVASCTTPIAEGMIVESGTERIRDYRKALVEMLFVEGNHFCMVCEKSGNCELQALAYRLGITVPRYPYLFPKRGVDASHPEVFIDRNRCILCGRCVRASRDLDGKHVFDFVGRGIHKRVAVDAEAKLGGTAIEVTDKAVAICPVGALLKKRAAYRVPVGQRSYDAEPIGAAIEERSTQKEEV